MSAKNSLIVVLALVAACDGSDPDMTSSEERNSPVKPSPGVAAPEKVVPEGSPPLFAYVFTKEESIAVFIDGQEAPEPVRIAFVDASKLLDENDDDPAVLYASKPVEPGTRDRGMWASWADLKAVVGGSTEEYVLILAFPNDDGSKMYALNPKTVSTHPDKDPKGEPGTHIHLTITKNSQPLQGVDIRPLKLKGWN